ncbi:uncharacterized protein LOC127241308 [Andrographis paniculata]|uniref:uncharacterized protein LOC127241308 n=1 Tax=Andrographis paniculata TaxID=175694 RepID=UPI0021E81D1D|nr:uncharacterized protein LOC127241308 [Andrographis paniculata]
MANQYIPALPFDGTLPEGPFSASKVLTPTIRPYCTTPEDLNRMREVLESRNSLAINSPNYQAVRIRDSIKTHLTDPKDPYRAWYRRVAEHFQTQWRSQKIDQAILLSTMPINLHEKVLLAMSAFWNAENGTFLFPSGPFGPTLMDVAMIAHLPVVGEDPVMGALDGQEPSENHPGWSLQGVKEWGWTKFATDQQGAPGTPVTDREHTAFILFWLCRYVIVSPSKCVLPSHLDLAIHIASGRFFSLGTLFLANLFEGLTRVSLRLTDNDNRKLDTAASGPFWFLELWFRLYFPNAFNLGSPPTMPTAEKHLGLALNRLCSGRNNLQSSDPIIIAVLTDTRSNSRFSMYKKYAGYAPDHFWPFPVPNPLPTPEPCPHSTYPFAWDVALKPRSLFSSKKLDKKGQKTFYTFNYEPQFMARQFGCCQGIPGPVACPHIIFQSPDRRVLPNSIPSYISQLTTYIISNSYIPFRSNPETVDTFTEWWSVIWPLISPDEGRLLNILLPPQGLVLGAARHTSTQPQTAAPGTGSSVPKRKRKASQLQTPPTSGADQQAQADLGTTRTSARTRPRLAPTTQPTPTPADQPLVPTEAVPLQTPTPLLTLPMSSQAEDPTRRQTLPPAPRSGRARHPTRRQSLPVAPIEPTPSPIGSAAGVSSDSEGTTSQMGRPPYMASDSSISKEGPTALAEADPQNDILDVADPEIGGAAEIPAAVALDAAAQPAAAQPAAALPLAIEWQAEEPPAAIQPPEMEEMSSSESETSVNLGPRSAPQRPFATADESAAIIPAVCPTRPTSLLHPSLTAVRPEGPSDLAVLSTVPVPAEARTIFTEAMNHPLSELRSDLLDKLIQTVGGLLFYTPTESPAVPILHRLMERLTELKTEVVVIGLLSAETPQPDFDQTTLENSLAKTRESLQQTTGRLGGLLSTKALVDDAIQKNEAELRELRKEQSTLDTQITNEQHLLEKYTKNEAELDQELKTQARSQFIRRYQTAANIRRLSRDENKWTQIKTALGALL